MSILYHERCCVFITGVSADLFLSAGNDSVSLQLFNSSHLSAGKASVQTPVHFVKLAACHCISEGQTNQRVCEASEKTVCNANERVNKFFSD